MKKLVLHCYLIHHFIVLSTRLIDLRSNAQIITAVKQNNMVGRKSDIRKI